MYRFCVDVAHCHGRAYAVLHGQLENRLAPIDPLTAAWWVWISFEKTNDHIHNVTVDVLDSKLESIPITGEQGQQIFSLLAWECHQYGEEFPQDDRL